MSRIGSYRRSISRLALALVFAGLGGACAAGRGDGFGNSSDTSAASGSGGNAASSSASGQGGDLGFATSSSTAGTGGSGLGPDACAADPYQAQRLPLDMYIMLDKSGSMNSPTAGGQSKWAAVTDAIKSFVSQSGLGDMAVGMQFFPKILTSSDCPSSCQTDADCMGHGQCVMSMLPATPGLCANCIPGADSCTTTDYATPSVEITALPGAIPAISAAISSHGPLGGTPTSAALQGAVDHAKDWAAAHPGRVTIAVLATDGEPNECDADPAHINAIAAAAASGSPAVPTFAIGVFTKYDIDNGAAAGLDDLAKAGGTKKATVIDTTQNVNQMFLDALNEIRDVSLACTYDIPKPQGGVPDFGKVNVQYTPAGGAPVIFDYYADQAHCPASGDGWYYDDPMKPTKILLCASSCSKVSADHMGKMDILIGCQTKLPT
jgi:hypothetical protein